MAISPDDADDLAAPAADAYAEAETGLLGRVAAQLLKWLSLDDWEERQRGATGALRRAVGHWAAGLFRKGRERATEALREAIRRGQDQAGRDLASAGVEMVPVVNWNAQADQREAELLAKLDQVEAAAQTQTLTAHQRITTRVAVSVQAGTMTRLKATAKALADFADEGITGFVDQRGRKWELRTYVEMAVRTAATNAMIDAHVAQIRAGGANLVVVSEAPMECEICRDWEGKVLTLDGPDGPHTLKVPHATRPGVTVTQAVAGSLAAARAAGLFHPNCRHSVDIWLPGVSTKPAKHPDQKASYEDSQKLRRLERQARKWDRRRAVAATGEDRKAAAAKWRGYRKQAAEFAAKTGQKRKTHRERHDAVR